MPARVEPCFETRMKISPGRPSSYSPTVTKPLQSATRNSKVRDVRVRGSLLADRRALDLLDELLDQLLAWVGLGQDAPRPLLLGGGERLGDLAVVAVDRDRLEAELPGLEMELLDVVDRDLFGHVDGLGDGTGDERLHGAHHLDVAHVVDRVVAHRAGEHRHVLGARGGARRGSTCARRCRRRSRRSARRV